MGAKSNYLPVPMLARGGKAFRIFLFIGGGLVLLPVILFVSTGDPISAEMGSLGIIYGMMAFVTAGLLWWDRRRIILRQKQLEELAAGMGLTFHERVPRELLAPFNRLSLFYVAGHFEENACDLFEGEFNGWRVLILSYGYSGKDSFGPRRRLPIRSIQTIFLLKSANALPDFHAGPHNDERNADLPGWSGSARIGKVIMRLDEYSIDPTLVRGHDERSIRQLFSPARIEALGSLIDCVLECRDGDLLFYCPEVIEPPEGIPRMLKRLIDMARILTMPEEQLAPLPKESTSRSTDLRIQE